jgi:hypothetical protein
MSVLFGADFPDILMLDIDDQIPRSVFNGFIEGKAARISSRWDLGDCLIVLSSVHHKSDCLDWSSVSYHLVYDRIMPWLQIHHIILRLAKEGKIDKNLARLSYGRGDLTLRLSPDRANDRMAPFPIGYVRGPRVRKGYRGGGIKKWLEVWRIAKKISFISESPSREAQIARK